MRNLTLLILCITALALSACMGSTGKSTVESFISAVNAGEINKAMELLTPELRQNGRSEILRNALESTAGKMKAKGGIKSTEVNGSDTGDIGEYKVVSNYHKGNTDTDTFKVRKNLDGKWYLTF